MGNLLYATDRKEPPRQALGSVFARHGEGVNAVSNLIQCKNHRRLVPCLKAVLHGRVLASERVHH